MISFLLYHYVRTFWWLGSLFINSSVRIYGKHTAYSDNGGSYPCICILFRGIESILKTRASRMVDEKDTSIIVRGI